MNELKEIFTENFKAALTSLGVEDYKKEEYVILPTTEQEKCTSRDEIYRLWVTPSFSGIRTTFDSVVDVLVKEAKKVAPLRIKLSKKNNGPVLLETSNRYRKLRDIAQRKTSNLIFPFEIPEETEMEFSEKTERIEAIRILFFKRTDAKGLKEIIGNEIKYKEVVKSFEKHFDQYSFYPPSYNHTKAGEESYSSLVIKKDFKTQEYSLFINPDIQKQIHSKLTLAEALNIYLKEELKYELYGVKIVNAPRK